jgi:hypothetical protein
LTTFQKAFKYLQIRYLDVQGGLLTLHPAGTWEEWIFQQCCLRVSTFYFMLAIVVNMDIGFTCDTEMDWRIEELPIPATKTSWEASDLENWRAAMRQRGRRQHNLTIADFMSSGASESKDLSYGDFDFDELGLIVGMATCLHTAALKEESYPLRL